MTGHIPSRFPFRISSTFSITDISSPSLAAKRFPHFQSQSWVCIYDVLSSKWQPHHLPSSLKSSTSIISRMKCFGLFLKTLQIKKRSDMVNTRFHYLSTVYLRKTRRSIKTTENQNERKISQITGRRKYLISDYFGLMEFLNKKALMKNCVPVICGEISCRKTQYELLDFILNHVRPLVAGLVLKIWSELKSPKHYTRGP